MCKMCKLTRSYKGQERATKNSNDFKNEEKRVPWNLKQKFMHERLKNLVKKFNKCQEPKALR